MMRSRLSDFRGPPGQGLDPRELWGIAQRDHAKPRKRLGEAARARRRAKRAAKAAGVPLKAWLRRGDAQ